MKPLSYLIIIVSIMLLFSTLATAKNAEQSFKDAYEETEILTSALLNGVSASTGGMFKTLDVDELCKTVDKLSLSIQTLEKAAEKMNKPLATYETEQMNLYLKRIKNAITTQEERDHLVTLLANYYLHYNNCVMLNPPILKKMYFEHGEELRASLSQNNLNENDHLADHLHIHSDQKNNLDEIDRLAEHLHIHSDQMFYSALIFNKPEWQQSATQAQKIADEIFQASLRRDIGAVTVGSKKITEYLNEIFKTVK